MMVSMIKNKIKIINLTFADGYILKDLLKNKDHHLFLSNWYLVWDISYKKYR